MSTEWDRHTQLTPTDGGAWSADLSEGWMVGGGLNGGYLLATIGAGIAAALPDKPDPLALSATYLSASRPGPARVVPRILRDGGRTASVAADLVQDDTARITVLGTFGRLGDLSGDVETTAEEIELAPREQCISNEYAPEDVRRIAPLMDRFDMLFDPSCIGWAMGEPSGRGEIKAWFRLKDGREPDPLALLMVIDALPPVTFDLGRPGWAPTIELTAHVRAVPAPGWLKVRHATRNIAGGMFEEDCEVWDSAGRLVAQGRQLALLPRPA